ncbi:MAG TPA: adenosylcobinamide amidohydrolase [Methylomirabilota bacterium]|jgi:adenosylcobinamide amidohydrolase|nr:adenosylcobinamide amidohydrolase [Methylomirabilota bacterium]
MIDGVAMRVTAEAVVVTAECLLRVLSSAPINGGVTRARTIVNVHVPKNFACADTRTTVTAFAARHGLPPPCVGLLTSAWTERAETATASDGDVRALVVATVGLSNRCVAGLTAPAQWLPATINTIAVVDADPAPAALVNLVITLTEVKVDVLRGLGVSCDDDHAATGTSTDAVVVAATGRGQRCAYGGPVTALGWAVARAAREALGAGVARWLKENP